MNSMLRRSLPCAIRSSSCALVVGIVLLTTTAACGVGGGEAVDSPTSTHVGKTTLDSVGTAEQLYPDVVEVEVSAQSESEFRFQVTISSPYDTSERYADAWRITDADGTVYGTRELLHDHATEQPFTRTLNGVEVPADVDVVIVQGRDLENGWGGTTMDVDLPRP